VSQSSWPTRSYYSSVSGSASVSQSSWPTRSYYPSATGSASASQSSWPTRSYYSSLSGSPSVSSTGSALQSSWHTIVSSSPTPDFLSMTTQDITATPLSTSIISGIVPSVVFIGVIGGVIYKFYYKKTPSTVSHTQPQPDLPITYDNPIIAAKQLPSRMSTTAAKLQFQPQVTRR
jgi:hypothetical protein